MDHVSEPLCQPVSSPAEIAHALSMCGCGGRDYSAKPISEAWRRQLRALPNAEATLTLKVGNGSPVVRCVTAQQIVDELTEGRFRDFLSNAAEKVKDVTGIGRDEFGAGKNTEKGWQPKYDGKRVAPAAKRPLIKRQETPGEKVWDIG